jgi:uncharacterized membrane protein
MSSQIPPPPPSQPAPLGGNPSSAGSNKKTYTVLAYALGWIGGLIFLFVGKDDPDVKWNAANSLLIFGGLSIVILILSFIPVVNFLVIILWLVGFVFWVIFLIQSLQGNGQRLPAPGLGGFLNPYVDQIAGAVK